jgi:hypothetical protein
MLAGCGGGSTSSGVKSSNVPPDTSFQGVAPNDSPLNQYTTYTFSASSVEHTIGRNVANFTWNFGDGTSKTVAAAGGASTISHAYQTSGTFSCTVQCADDQGLPGTLAAFTEVVQTAASPVTVTATSPTAATTLQVVLNGSVGINFLVGASTTAAGATLPVSGFAFNPGESAAALGTIVANGDGTFTIPVTYTAASALGSRTVTPTLTVTDSLGNASAPVTFPTLTITTTGTNNPPSVVITSPSSSPTSAFTSKPVTLNFTVTDLDNDPVTYTVDWGDGSTKTTASTGSASTSAGAPVSLPHTYADAYTSTTKAATVTVSVTDGRITGAQPSKTTVFNIAFNAYPTATITSPQASGTLPSSTALPSNPATGLVNPPTATDPGIVVIPNGGMLSFSGTGTAPGSGDTALTYTWNFSGGVPVDSSKAGTANPGNVMFPDSSGQLTPHLVTLTVTDAFNRVSSAGAGAKPATYKKWVIVDGNNTQKFDLKFLYRQISDNNGVVTLSPVTTSTNGLGATVQLFQDGLTSSYTMQSATQASISVPVRSNLSFYIKIPSFSSADGRAYMMRIPNSPSGADADPTLQTSSSSFPPLDSSNNDIPTEGFGFRNPSTPSGPWNPVLELVTAQGFAAETAAAGQRNLQGSVDLPDGNNTDRWLWRMSSLTTAPLWEQASNTVVTFYGIAANQSFAEWPLAFLATPTVETTSAGSAAKLGFNLDYSTYAGENHANDTYQTFGIQAFRAPGASGDPYDLDVANWGSDVAALQPTSVSAGVAAFYQNAIFGSQGGSAFSGGLTGLAIPYDANDVNRQVVASTNRDFNGIKNVFGFAEYLWSRVWAWPAVLNSAEVSYLSLKPSGPTLSSFTGLRYSAATVWPSQSGITPRNSAFDLNAVPGGVFDASFPAAENGGTPSHTGVGRFFWTVFTPWYNSVAGGTIARTWLADSTLQPPTSFSGASSGDATAAFGFLPPQDTIVDKRARNADGSLVQPNPLPGDALTLGGYRVTWFNPTKDASGNPVPPDFWVVELVANGETQHIILPSSFPARTPYPGGVDNSGYPTFASSGLPNPDAIPVLTDARVAMTSGQIFVDPATKLVPMQTVAPGYCWFDVPPELRPVTGSQATLRVYALKAITKNNPNGLLSPRRLNRLEWIDAIKTALANISVKASDGTDLSDVYKIPFNYPWDIVVVNGPATPVQP